MKENVRIDLTVAIVVLLALLSLDGCKDEKTRQQDAQLKAQQAHSYIVGEMLALISRGSREELEEHHYMRRADVEDPCGTPDRGLVESNCRSGFQHGLTLDMESLHLTYDYGSGLFEKGLGDYAKSIGKNVVLMTTDEKRPPCREEHFARGR